MLQGIGVVNATPLTTDGKLNEAEYCRHVDWLMRSGVGFIQPHAATGQGALSSAEEYRRVLELSVETVGDRGKVTAYAGRMSTDETIDALRVAAKANAHAAFVIPPWFSRPDETGLWLHFEAIAKSTEIPIVIYNNPQRAGLSLSVDFIERLIDAFPDVFIGLKQTELGDVIDSFLRLKDRIDVSPYGDAELLWGLAMGCKWSISYSANVIAPHWVDIFDAWKNGEPERAMEIYYKWMPLVRATHYEPIPGPIKYMMNKTGWDFGASRLPIHEVTSSNAERIDKVLDDLRVEAFGKASGLR